MLLHTLLDDSLIGVFGGNDADDSDGTDNDDSNEESSTINHEIRRDELSQEASASRGPSTSTAVVY